MEGGQMEEIKVPLNFNDSRTQIKELPLSKTIAKPELEESKE